MDSTQDTRHPHDRPKRSVTRTEAAHRWAPPTPTAGRTRPPAAPPARGAWRRASDRLAATPVSAIIAASGSLLLLIAAVVVVASRWRSIPDEARVAGLVASLIAVYGIAETARVRLPSTAGWMAALAATLTAPATIAACAAARQEWPVCVIVGGAAALIAIEVQSRRWHLTPLLAMEVLAVGLISAGIAAIGPIPAPLAGALAAAVALSLGATGRATALALCAGGAPLLVVLADLGVGPGTLARVDAHGTALAWSAPMTGAIAGTVLAIVAQRGRWSALAWASVAVVSLGVLTGMAVGDGDAIAWWCLPSIVLILVEIARAVRAPAHSGSEADAARVRPSLWRDIADTIHPWVVAPVALGAALAPLVALLGRSLSTEPTVHWAIVSALAAAGLGAAASNERGGRAQPWRTSVFVTTAGGAMIATAILAGVAIPVIAAAIVPAVAVSRRWTSRSTDEIVAAAALVWGISLVLGADGGPVWFAALVLAGLALVALAAIVEVDRRDGGCRLLASSAVLGLAASSLVDTPWQGLTFAAVVLVMSAIASLRRDGPIVAPVGFVAVLLIEQLDRSGSVGIDHVIIAGLVTATVAVAGWHRPIWRHVAGVAAVATVELWLLHAAVSPDRIVGVNAVLAIAATGLAMLRTRPSPLDTLAVTAGAALALAAPGAMPAVTSLAFVVVGVQAMTFGAARRLPRLAGAGVAVSAASTISLWFSTGTHGALLDALAPYGADGTDVLIAIVGILMLLAGGALHRTFGTSTWVAFGPGLGLLVSWLLSSQFDPASDWAAAGALVFGVVALGVAGLVRSPVTAVAGAASVGGTLAISAGPRLADAPTWAWIAVGGAALLAIAAVVERRDRASDGEPLPCDDRG